MLKDLVVKNRSTRRFKEEKIDRQTLLDLVDLARLSPSASNRQALKFIISNESAKNATIFELLGWAGALKPWPGPSEGQRPSGYIIILGDTRIAQNFGCDHGIAAQTILLGAVEKGLNGCMLGSVKKDVLKEKLNIPAHFEVLLAIALGKQGEKIVLEVLPPGAPEYKYWRDAESVHHVPKRTLEELIIG
jgi:nitroreductase